MAFIGYSHTSNTTSNLSPELKALLNEGYVIAFCDGSVIPNKKLNGKRDALGIGIVMFTSIDSETAKFQVCMHGEKMIEEELIESKYSVGSIDVEGLALVMCLEWAKEHNRKIIMFTDCVGFVDKAKALKDITDDEVTRINLRKTVDVFNSFYYDSDLTAKVTFIQKPNFFHNLSHNLAYSGAMKDRSIIKKQPVVFQAFQKKIIEQPVELQIE